jgi:MYXO-CTERM domain-containing protein
MHVGAWRIDVEEEGWYRIDTQLAVADPSSSIYRIESARGEDEVALDPGEGAQELGVFYLEPGDSYLVSKGVVPDEAGTWLGFDAIELTPDEGPSAGCGCSTSSRRPGGLEWLLLLTVGGVFTRRRASRRV